MASSTTADQQKLKARRIRCEELGITTDEEEILDFLVSSSIPLAIKYAEERIALAEERIALAEERIAYANLERKSMENTYGKTKDNFKQPPIQLNTGVEPSVSGYTRKKTIKDSEGKLKDVTMKIPEVKIRQDCQEMWVDVNNIAIPVMTSDGIKHECILGAVWNDPKKLEYANEFKVQSYCENMIRDALRALGLLDETDTHLEFSMYLMKPDIVIVVKCHGRVIFAVDVKSPEVNGKKVFGNEMVAGQIWSYLFAMKASGNAWPIGAIMTYNKISIVTLGDYTKNEEGEEDVKHKARIETAQKCLSTGRSPQRELQKEVKKECETRKESPGKPSKDFTKTNREDNEELQEELWEEAIERNAFCSRVHVEKEVFPCLLQAIEIAYRAICDADDEQLVRVEENAPIGRRLVFKLGEDSFDWVKLGGKVLAKIDGKVPNKNTNSFYILGKLGDGGIASVYLACSSGGKVCAMKDYFIERSSAAHAEAREGEENEECKNLIEKAEKEAGRWAEIYDSRFEARAKCLGGKHCLLMPYGHQVAAENRWKHVPGIRKELELFAQGIEKGAKARPGYKYKKSDLRWHHVLLDTKKNIFLCDLESLETTGDNTESQNEVVVYEQLAILLKPMRNEEKERDTLDWLLRSETADVVSFICGNGTLKDFFEGISRDGDTGVTGIGTLKDLFEGINRYGDTEATEQYGEILESLFPSTATFEGLSANPKAVVTMCMISHYRKGQPAKRQRQASQSDTSIPGLEESQSTEEDLGSGENPEDANKAGKRAKTSV